MNRELVEKKLIQVATMIESEEYKRAEELVKKATKIKDEIKNYCQKEKITEIKVEREERTYSVEYKVRESKGPDTKLLEPEILDSIMVKKETWLQYFKIVKKN